MSEKLSNLRAVADKTETFSYMQRFTSDEIAEMKDQFAELSIKLGVINDEFKEIKDEFKERTKPLQKELGLLLSNIKQKSRAVTEECFVEFDHDINMAKYFSPTTGELVNQRPLMPNEMQMSIREMHTGTDGK